MRSLVSPLYLSLLPALLLTALPVHAALVTYTDAASFTAASTGLTTIGFEGVAPANSYAAFNDSLGYKIDGLQFLGVSSAVPSYALRIVDSGSGSPYWNFGSGATLESPSYDRSASATFLPYIHVNLPASVTAFSAELMTVSPNALTYQVAVQGTSFSVPTAVRPNRTFFGLTSDAPISFIDFTVAGTTYNGGTFGLIDNVQFGSELPPTPEGATFLLIGSGLVVLRIFRKRLLRLNTTSIS